MGDRTTRSSSSSVSEVDNLDNESTASTVLEPRIFINELLCFANNNLNVLPVDEIVRLCDGVFSLEDVRVAKQTLLDIVGEAIADLKIRWRSGKDAKVKNLMDILMILQHHALLDLIPQPLFVALQLSKLPSVTPTHIDMSSLMSQLRQINSVFGETSFVKQVAAAASSSSLLENTAEDVKILKAEVGELKSCLRQVQGLGDRTLHKITSLSTPSAGAVSPTKDLDRPLSTPPPSGATLGPPVGPTPVSHPDNMEQAGASAHSPSPSAVVPAGDHSTVPLAPPVKAPPQPSGVQSVPPTSPARGSSLVHPDVPYAEMLKNLADDDGFQTPSYHKRRTRNYESTRPPRPVVLGTKKSTVLSVVNTARTRAIFISRLAPDCDINDIVKYVRDSFGITNPICTRLRSKRDNYASFKVSCPSAKLKELLDPGNWIEGVLVREFFEPRSW